MRSRAIGAGLFAVAGLALACGGGEDAKPSGAPLVRERVASLAERGENHAPVVERVALNPQKPLAGQPIEARIDVSDADGDPIRLELEWRQDGRVIRSGSATSIVPERLGKGEQIQVTVTASDGRDSSAPVRASVRGGNQAPLIQTLYLAPKGDIAPGQEVTAQPQVVDADGDTLEYEYEWLVNGQVVRGAASDHFDTSRLSRGDRLQARLRVSDGEAESPAAESMTLTLANRAPRFSGLPAIKTEGGMFRADLEAKDPDGDRSLRYRVVNGPPGLTVDAVSGRLAWRPGPEDAGNHTVEVAVADSAGAESALSFELTVAQHEAAAAPPPAKKRPADEESDE